MSDMQNSLTLPSCWERGPFCLLGITTLRRIIFFAVVVMRRHSGISDECKEFGCCIGYDGGNIPVVAGGHYSFLARY